MNAELDRKREGYRHLLKTSVAKVVDELSQKETVRKISLFGSYAQGRADLFTDLDLLIIMDTDKPFLERTREIYALLALPVDADILCYTPEEFDRLKENRFFKQILAREVILYEKDSS